MSDADISYSYLENAGYRSSNVNPMKLAYRGVLIERPCVNCNTVDVHFEGKCNSGSCQYVFALCDDAPELYGPSINRVCGIQRYGRRSELNHGRQYIHDWVAPTYYPADFEAEDFEKARKPHSWGYIRGAAEKAFDAILDKVRELGEPRYYTSDLFRDYQILTSRGHNAGLPPPTRFVWALRAHSCGSDIYRPNHGIIYDPEPGTRFFLYDGLTHGPLGDFVECNLTTARTILSVWRQSEIAGLAPHTFVEGCCMAPEEAALHGSIVINNLLS